MLARAAMVSLEGSRLLAGQVLVHGELVDLRWTPCNACGGHPRSDAVCREPVEVLARLPEVNHAPTAVYRTGRVEDHSIQGIAVRVDRRLELVELLGGDASQLESDSYSHWFLLRSDQAIGAQSSWSLTSTG